MPNLGFIGLGTMGTPMATNLLKTGHRLAVHARRAEAMQSLIAAGAHPCGSPREVAAQSEVIFTMVTDTNAVEQIALGEQGIIHGAKPGSVVIDMSTISPVGTRRIAARLKEHGVEMLDAPVSGGALGAEAATLSIMVGGEAGVFERCKPLLECLGKTIVHIGASGAGQVTKACNQICVLVNQLGVAEAMLLAGKCGVDPRKVKDALMGGFAASRILEVQAPKMIARDFNAEAGKIESRLHHKDLGMVLELAEELGLTLPASMLAADLLSDLQNAGGAKQDSAAIFTVIERLK